MPTHTPDALSPASDRPAPYAPPTHAPLFDSVLMAGFECSSHRLRSGRRLDMVAASRHDRFALEDYRRCAGLGIRTVRDGVRWHLAEQRSGEIRVAHEVARVRAAQEAGVQVIWDLWHYGTPDHLDVFDPGFADRLARFARAFAEMVAGETGRVPYYCPVNEISFVAWAGGDVAYLNPFKRGRGGALKRQLARAAIAATRAVREVDARARVCHVDPVIHIVPAPGRPRDAAAAERHRRGMYEAWDMIAGRREPELGGAPELLDVVGVNFYARNEWVHRGRTLSPDDPRYRPLSAILGEVHARYGRPLFVAETGIEHAKRAAWLRLVGAEVRAARAAGVPVEGLCWYPILNHPGWDDDRHLQCGLWDYADDLGGRRAHAPLLAELRDQQRLFAEAADGGAGGAVRAAA